MTGPTRTEVIRDPAIMSGNPVVRGTRVPAETIVAYLRGGHTPQEIFEDYPSLPVDGIEAVIRWAETTYGADWKASKQPPFSLAAYELQRDPDENEEDYARRRSLFEDAGPPKANPMRTVSLEDIGDADVLLRAADDEPVIVVANGRPSFVVMSMREYDRLRGRSGVGGTIVELTEERIAAIETAQVQTDVPYNLSDLPEVDDGPFERKG